MRVLKVAQLSRCGALTKLHHIAGVPPALVAMAIVVPRSVPHAGVLSLGLGWGAPLFIYLANSIGWSVPAYAWVAACGAMPPT